MISRREIEAAEMEVKEIVDRRNKALEDLQAPGISDEAWQDASKRFLDESANLKCADRKLGNLLAFYRSLRVTSK